MTFKALNLIIKNIINKVIASHMLPTESISEWKLQSMT